MIEQDKWNAILDTLRESGAMNMFGAPRYLNEEFGIPMHQAKEIFMAWTLTYTKEETMYDISEKGEKQYKRVQYLIYGLYVFIPLVMIFFTNGAH